MSTFKRVDVPELGFWEKVDLPFSKFSIIASALYATLIGPFRGKSYPKKFKHHLISLIIRNDPFSTRQRQYSELSTPEAYESTMKERGLIPEQVPLPHDADGYWIGNKTAKNVLVYYHGGGFAMAARPSHFSFWIDLIKILNENGHDIAVFFLRYTLTPHKTYPTQLRQAVGALRYILNETGRSPADVILGGDSAGANLAMATLLHISHPHPEIEPLKLSAPLAGVFGFAPWVNFSSEWPSMTENAYKDICTVPGLKKWSDMYLDGKEGDYWSEPSKAPVEWWADSMTERILILAGGDEILLSPIEAFAKNIKSVFPNTTFVVGSDESHDMHLYVDAGVKEGTQTGNELRRWIAARL
ncbi:uncharacterized protein N7484_002228 [Penicillium longicatenatum]|uniref:uncharacterized protein n=1 Tax=Penicillium longicatenatum TaxID=1561947 RepID=UPI002548C230|nr:uncharacterized protein N7484_002228 [Penicillium longicatenatum]KAJ5658579.1 hypothetical protein N7484_002228 [Penicillium longicatenatum]